MLKKNRNAIPNYWGGIMPCWDSLEFDPDVIERRSLKEVGKQKDDYNELTKVYTNCIVNVYHGRFGKLR